MIATIPIIKKKSFSKNARFSILIPSWNNLAYLRLCVSSIRRNSHFSHQIIIHINEGTDGTREWLDGEPDLDYTFSRENIGICYGVNIARGLATADFIVYMNDDMYVCPDWDLELDREIRAASSPYFFFSSTVIEPTYTANSCVIVMDCGKDLGSFQEKKLLDGYQAISFGDWQGATWPPNVVHKDLWDLVGGYSTEFSPGMYSDPDFSMKLWQAGVRLFKGISKSRTYHFGSKSTGRIKVNKGYYTFIQKWKMTSGTFSTKFLKRGEPFTGALQTPRLSFWLRIKNRFRQIVQVFRG
jgi:glycosyltransferase involved in cell wall biosynthesis